jgi:methylmalonyl-CoA mutase N-terminal domain/subunit
MMLRFHTQTGGSTLTAQQVENNIVRVAYQAMAAVLGGTQSLHTNGMDEALGLPTEKAAVTALRTQQIVAHETGVTDTVDPLAGSYFVEALTAEIEARVMDYIERVDEMGGSISAIERRFFQNEIRQTSYETQRKIDAGERVIVGLNKYQSERDVEPPIFHVDDSLRAQQIDKLKVLRASRDGGAVEGALAEIARCAKGTDNLMPAVVAAVEVKATLGEIAHTLRKEWGTYQE